MKTSHTDVFQSLDGVRAFNITKVQNKQLDLKDEFMVSDHLSDGEEVLFEIDSANFWLRIKFQLYSQRKLTIEGFTQVRINKNETI